MSDTPDDTRTSLEDLIRQMMELAGTGQGTPILIGMQIVISPGQPGRPGPIARGDGTEPEIEVHTFGNRVTLVTELPGMSPENIQVLFRDDRVFIWAKDAERYYRASATVPRPLKGSVEINCRHGVLEVSYTPLKEAVV
jgi:HSP20 family molecular chaperone IbpA